MNESATELRMSQKERLHEWLDSEGRMVIKIQREAHALQRCIVADCRGQSFPMLLELVADRSFRNCRPVPQESFRDRGLRDICGVPGGCQGIVCKVALTWSDPPLGKLRDTNLHVFFCAEVPQEVRSCASGPWRPRDSTGLWPGC